MLFDIEFSRKVLFKIWSSSNTSPKLIEKFFPVTKQDSHDLLLCIEKFIQFLVGYGTPNSNSICNIAFKLRII